MGETARQRWHRMQEERQRGEGGKAIAHPDLKPDAPMRTMQSVADVILAAARLKGRQRKLCERLGALGLLVSPDELPADDAGLSELERFADQSEAAK